MHSPFGNPSVCVGDPQTQGALQDAPYLNSLHLNGVVLDETFDTVIPSAPSLDNFLSASAVTGMDARLGSALLTLGSSARSLSAMGSLDLSWLAEVGPAASMQRQPSAAEIVMGQQPQMPVELPPAPALCTTYPPFHNQATVAADHSRHAGHQVLNNPGAQPSPLVGSHAGGGLTDVECAVLMQHQAVLQQHVHNYMAAAAAAGVLPGVSRPFIDVSDALRCSSPLGGAPGMPAWPAASQGFVPGGFMAVPGGGTSVPVPVSTPSMSPERPPTFTSSSQSGGTAEAMALWAQQNALMQALSSSDMNTAAHAVGALTAGTGGMLGIRPMGAAGFGAQQCPFQVEICSKPTLCVAPASPVRLSHPAVAGPGPDKDKASR